MNEGNTATTAAANQSMPRRMLNEEQLLRIIPVSRTTLYRMAKNGRGMAKLGR
jgi:prophage regulatory protein